MPTPPLTSRSTPARLIAPALLGAAALTVSGCKVGPNYQAPGTDTTGAYTHAGNDGFATRSNVDQSQLPDPQWWQMLNDPALDRLVSEAAANNLDVRLATSRIRQARAQRGIVASEGLPVVDVNGNVTRSRESRNVRGGTFNAGEASTLYSIGFDATWELDFFGRVARNVEAANADIQFAQEDRRAVLVTLVSEVARNYVELRGAQQRLAIARRNIDIQRSTLELTRSRFRAGLTSDLDVAQAESSLAAVVSTVPSLDEQVQAAIHRIGVLLGKQPTALIAELSPEGAIPLPPSNVPIGLPSDLLRRRPDIRRAERDIAASTARIGVATADLFPRFSLTGSFGFAADKVPTIPDASSRFWSFGPAVSWPILDWNRIRSNIAVQDSLTEQAWLRYERACLTAFEDTENALVNYSREQDRRKSLAEAVASNQRAFDLANQLYTSGLTDFQRVLDSQRALFLTQDQLVDSDRAVTSNLVALYKALGGGWETFSPVEEPPQAPRTLPLPPPSSLLTAKETDPTGRPPEPSENR